ncbi:hypothetical protein [Rhizobacter sp. LjRoot28]|jgi:hypothetical protein|uniref:hypothetical protein n=1 Tax=Rhizobacter sp. LjRoot28 TaxID=3342309 RepID=UPI003ECF9B0E
MSTSRQIAALVGPTLVAVLLAEFPLVQPHLYDAQTPPVIYLSGVLLFVAGLAIVRVHNTWAKDWTVLVTLSGWAFLLLGLVRMFGAVHYRNAVGNASSWHFMALEAALLGAGLFITYKGYRRPAG